MANTAEESSEATADTVPPPPLFTATTPEATRQPSEREAHFNDLTELLASRQRQEQFHMIFANNVWGSDESRSGDGSTMGYTQNVRSLLAFTIAEYGITDWIDAPCGDCNWQSHVEGFEGLRYLGIDIVPALIADNTRKFANASNMAFQQQDFINEPFPHAPDLILCRDMIQHNTLVDGVRAYFNMEQSNAKYLATTWHNRGQSNPMAHNANIPSGSMYEVNIFLHPFNFSKPEFFIHEGPDGLDPQGKIVGVWKLPALGLGDGAFFDVADHLERARHEIVHVDF